jgi:hypothetical protein
MEAPATNRDLANILSPRRFALLLAALVLIQFPDVVLGLKTFFFRDYGFFGYPLAAYHRDSFWRGEIPLWNPYNNAGLPFLAQWNTMVLYPGSLIYLLLPLPWSLGIFCLAHQYLAGLGMYFLGRASAKSDLGGAIAGISFAFGGLLLCSLKWPNNIAAFGCMPWVVLAALYSRSIGLAALIGGLQMLTGAPEVIFLTWVIVGVVTLADSITQKSAKPLLRLAAIVALVSLIAAAQLLPFLDLLAHSQRSAKFGGADWPMPWWGWANFFVPLFGTFPSYHGVPAQPEQYWTSTYYVPLAAVALATLAVLRNPRARLLAAIALFGAIMALGDHGLLYKLLRSVAPLGFMRFPIKFVVLPIFILPWLAAFGAATQPSRKSIITIAAFFSVICVALALSPSPFNPTQFGSTIWFNAIGRVLLLSFFAALFFQKAKWIPIALLVLLWVDGRTQTPEQNPRAPRWVFDRDIPIMTNAPTLGHGRAMLDAAASEKLDHLLFETAEEDIIATRLSLYCNANLINEIPKVDGFYSLYPRETAQLIDRMYSDTNVVYPALQKLFAVTHKNLPGKTREWEQISDDQLWISAGQKIEFTTPDQTIDKMFSPTFDPDKTIFLLESERDNPDLTKDVFLEKADQIENHTQGKITFSDLKWARHHISFRATGGTGIILIKQAFDSGWGAIVAGLPAQIYHADHGFQAIWIGRDCEVELIYTNWNFRIGCLLSILGLLIAAGNLFRSKTQ